MGGISKSNVTGMSNSYIQLKEKKDLASSRQRKKLVRRLTAFFIFASLMSTFLFSYLISQSAQIDIKQKELVNLESKLSKLERQETNLDFEIVKLNDDEYIGKLARSEYFFSGKGEIIFSIDRSENERE